MWAVLPSLFACRAPDPPPRPHDDPPPSEESSPEDTAPETNGSTGDTAEGATGDTGTEPLDCSFTHCGGNFTGITWTFADQCPGTGTTESVSFQCDRILTSWLNTYVGTITFDPDGTYVLDVSSWTSTSSHQYGAECVPDGCDALAADLGYESCVDDGLGGCNCPQELDLGGQTLLGEWWIDSYYGQSEELQIGQIYSNGSMSFEQWRWCVTDEGLRVRDQFGSVTVLVP